ncbi:hypothetical protein ABK040_002239 [Willaertia magna]
MYWVKNRILSKIGYEEWSTKEVLRNLQKKKLNGGANISQELLLPLFDLNFNGEHLNMIVNHLKYDYNNYDNYVRIMKLIENNLKTQFNSQMKEIMKLIILWIENNLMFVIQTIPSYNAWDYSLVNLSETFTFEEMKLLERISKLDILDLSKPQKLAVDRLLFDLMNREDATKLIKTIAVNQYAKCLQKEITKQDCTFLIEPISMICSRIIYATFRNPTNIEIPKISKRIFLFELLRIISQKLHERFNLDFSKPIPLIIALDEYQLATRFINDLNSSLQHSIGWYMKRIQRYHGLVILPVFGGTLTEKDAKFEPTQYTSKQIPLPSLRPEDIETIMKKEKVDNLYTQKYKYFWDLIGAIPRHLEWAIEEAKSTLNIPVETRISTIYTNVSKRINNYYMCLDYRGVIENLALITLSGFKFEPLHIPYLKEINKLVSRGLVYKKDTHIGVPPTIIDQLSNDFKYIPNNLLTNFIIQSKKEDCDIFEELSLKTLTCRLNYFVVVRGIKNFSVGELFKGCIMPEKLEKPNFFTNVNGFTYRECKETLSAELITEENVTKARKNQIGMAGFLPALFYEGNKKLLFVIQYLQDETKEVLLGPSGIATFYEKALLKMEDFETYVIILTNKKVSETTKSMIVNGELKYNEKVDNKSAERICDCNRLVLMSGNCFETFFHPYLSGILVQYRDK